MISLSLLLARRYIWGRKSTHAIQVISAVSALGIAIGSGALIIVLSVLNGFETTITNFYGQFNPPLKITPRQGKVFDANDSLLAQLQATAGVAHIAPVLEETALFEQAGAQSIGIIKGVTPTFDSVSRVQYKIIEGRYQISTIDSIHHYAVVGIGIATALDLVIDTRLNSASPLTVYMARREASRVGGLGLQQPFRSARLLPSGTFEIQQDFDHYVLCPLPVVRQLLGYSGTQASALEVAPLAGTSTNKLKQQLQAQLGADFLVRDRYEQDAAFYKITNLEKWISFLILSFILLIVAFNMVGSLWMIITDKHRDIAMLQYMGAPPALIGRTFLYQGLLLGTAGMLLGFIVATALCLGQQQYGWVKLHGNGNFLIQSYPVALQPADFLAVAAVVLAISTAASALPAVFAARLHVHPRNT